MSIRVAGTVSDSITDGPGIRYTLFVQGCPHHCPGCHNPQTHDFSGGREMEEEEISSIVTVGDLYKYMQEHLDL